MRITVDRNSGTFEPSVCDLINIKSQRIETLLDQLSVPDIAHKETIRPFFINFKPINISVETPLASGEGKLVSTLHIGKMTSTSVSIGKVNIISLVFDDIKCDSYPVVPGQPDDPKNHLPFFATDNFIHLAHLNVAPQSTIHFRAIPSNPSKEENPLAVIDPNNPNSDWAPLGDAMLVKVNANSFDMLIKGLVLNKAQIPVHSFFILES